MRMIRFSQRTNGKKYVNDFPQPHPAIKTQSFCIPIHLTTSSCSFFGGKPNLLVQMVSVSVGKQYVEGIVSLWSPDKVEVPRCSCVAVESTRNGLLSSDCWSNPPNSRLWVELPNSSSSLSNSVVAGVLSRIGTPGEILKGLLMSSPTMGEGVDNEASMTAG